MSVFEPFVDQLRRRAYFARGDDVVVSRAPGRLDVMGGIADYSGSLVLELPIAMATLAAVQRQRAAQIDVVSMSSVEGGPDRCFSISASQLIGGDISDYAAASAYFRDRDDDAWAAYVLGCVLVLAIERGATFGGGLKVLISSDVPESKGVSSSAALEVSVMQAVAEVLGIEMDPIELARLSQVAENRVAGAPCGIMDQITVACGQANRLLSLRCQPADILGQVEIPQDIGFWGIDSGIRHAVSGASYGSVRTGAFMGYRVIADCAGLPVNAIDGCVEIEDSRWQGYLANVTPSEFEQAFASRIPHSMAGRAFLDRYGGITDTVTQVDPATTYAVRVPTAHPIYEHFRVRLFARSLAQPMEDQTLQLLGELMYQSHASYSACDLGSDGTDLLVQLVRQTGSESGLYGAKITGGGSGGTVAVLGRVDAETTVQQVAEEYQDATGHCPLVFSGSSPGAAATGTVRVKC